MLNVNLFENAKFSKYLNEYYGYDLNKQTELYYRIINGEELDEEEEFNLNEMANFISQTKDSTKTTNQSSTQTSDAAETKEKDPLTDAAGLAAKHYISMRFNRSFISSLTKLTPATLIMTLLGVDPEEDGNALKKGALSGKGGNFKEAFKGLIKNYDDALEKAMKEGTWPTIKQSFKQVLGFVPNCGAAIVTNALKYVGKGLSKVLGKEFVSALGSGVAVAGKLLNSIGESVANVLGGTFKGIKELFSGNTQKAGEAFKNIGKKFKDIGISIKDKAVEFAKDVKKFVTQTVPEKAKKVWNKTKEFVTNTVPEAGKKIWKKIKRFLPWRR